MGSKIEYVKSSQIYATNYIRNSRAIGVLWGIFTICYTIIGVVAFVTPEWIGDEEHENKGKFGLWSRCIYDDNSKKESECMEKFGDFLSTGNVPFKASTILIGISVLIALLSMCSMILFFFCQSKTVFLLCGWMQFISAICMGVGVGVYPIGWDSPMIKSVCGIAASRYNPGSCAIKWALPLAAIAALDALTLAILAFILASRHVKLRPESLNNKSLYKVGEVNPAYVQESIAGSRKSLSLRPVALHDQDDAKSHQSLYSPGIHVHTFSTNTLNHSQRNFQL